MIEYVEIGPVPCNEECAQLGEANYVQKSKHECRIFLKQLKRLIESSKKKLPESFSLVIKSNIHDYGCYYEVACKFDSNDLEACDLAFWLEENCPINWDDISKAELNA